MKLVAMRDLSYAGKLVRKGDVFEADNRFGKVLKAVHRAVDHVEPAAAPPPRPAKARVAAPVPLPAEPAPAAPAEPVLAPAAAVPEAPVPSEPQPVAPATMEEPMANVELTPVEPMTTKDNGALVPTRRGAYQRRDIEPAVTSVMTAEPAAPAGDAG